MQGRAGTVFCLGLLSSNRPSFFSDWLNVAVVQERVANFPAVGDAALAPSADYPFLIRIPIPFRLYGFAHDPSVCSVSH